MFNALDAYPLTTRQMTVSSLILTYSPFTSIHIRFVLSGFNLFMVGLYASPNIIRVIKSRRMRWAGHVACMGEMRNAYSILVGKHEGKRLLKN